MTIRNHWRRKYCGEFVSAILANTMIGEVQMSDMIGEVMKLSEDLLNLIEEKERSEYERFKTER